MLSGLLVVNKPGGMTSRTVVDRVQRFVRPAKVGHAGTLDPLATGVLVVAIGPAVRLVEYVQQMAKHYRATFQLGVTSPSDDVDTPLVSLANPPIPSREELQSQLQSFVGRIDQRPPDFSAVHVEGQRAYDLARAGQPLNLAPRPVEIHRLELLRYDYPLLELDIVCGSGTYIRSLGRDLADRVGTGAVMSSLVRTRIGEFALEQALELEAIDADVVGRFLLPLETAVTHLPRIELTAEEERRIGHGMTIGRSTVMEEPIAAFGSQGNLVAILISKRGGQLGPTKCFVNPAK